MVLLNNEILYCCLTGSIVVLKRILKLVIQIFFTLTNEYSLKYMHKSEKLTFKGFNTSNVPKQ